MGKSHSKTGKSPTSTASMNEKAPLSPRQKRDKLKKQKKSIYSKKKSKLADLRVPNAHLPPDISEIRNEKDLEVEIKRHMQDQLAFNSDIFVLNQMMMSVQFFANYER